MAESKGLALRVMFQDEGRFGRIQDPTSCWAKQGSRPLVGAQLVRQYTYAFGAVSPQDGKSDFLILPSLDKVCFSIFLEEISKRYEGEYILMFCDGASAHSTSSVKIPENIVLQALPPYSPELNPQENIWDDMREKWFKNKTFKSMDEVIGQLEKSCTYYENESEICQSIASFPWMIYN